MHTITAFEVMGIAFGIGWLAGFFTRQFGMSKREGRDILRKAVRFGFRIDGDDYICVKKTYGNGGAK